MKKLIEYDFFIITLCNTDLENQEFRINNEEEAKNAADSLRRFLPVSLIHSVILEGIRLIDVGNEADEDGYIELEEKRDKLTF